MTSGKPEKPQTFCSEVRRWEGECGLQSPRQPHPGPCEAVSSLWAGTRPAQKR